MKWKDVSDDLFIETVRDSKSVRDIVQNLGFSRNSGSMARLVRHRLKELNVDVEHLTNARANYPSSYPKHPLEQLLTENSKVSNMSSFKSRLLSSGKLLYVCSECGNKGEHNGKPLTLQLDHINGINTDNRIENLRILCPNCHTQTDTYGSKNLRKKV